MIIHLAGADWRIYTSTLPESCELIGVVSSGAVTGALVKFNARTKATRGLLYAIISKCEIYPVDGRKLSGQFTRIGQPAKLGKKYTIKLSEEQAEKARQIGGGRRKMAEGVRRMINEF